MLKSPSLQNVLKAITKTILRFPLEVITGIIGTILACLLVDMKYYDPNKESFAKAIMCCSLCLVLFLSISLFFLASKKNNLLRFITSLILGSLAIVFVFNFHKDITEVEIQQFIVLNIAFHLLVSFAGFIPKVYNQEEFWEFNKQLFLRILTAALYSSVLFCGLAFAIFAIKELFKIDFNDKIYSYLFFIIAGIFNTIFFLNGVPETNNNKQPLTLNYPNGLKNFTQYILLPLISLYLIILIGYEMKIVFTLSLPIGWVSYLVLIFAIFGILSFLLVHPIATETGNLWMRNFNRWFYFLLIPLLGLLFWAILYRIHLYGFTHERYYVLLLSFWLAIVVLYFLIKKQPKIKFIPISMCIAGLLSIVGPQSADIVSKNSQLARFEFYMQKIEKEKLSFEQEQDLSSIIDFLEKNYTAKILIPSAKGKLTSLFKKNNDPNTSDIMEAFGLKYRSRYEEENNTNPYFNYDYNENEDKTIENIHDYDLSLLVTDYSKIDCKNCIEINNTKYSIKSIKKDYGTDIQINKDTIPLNINDFVNKNSGFDKNESDDKIIQIIDYAKYNVSITYINVSGDKKGKQKITNNYSLKVMIKIKN